MPLDKLKGTNKSAGHPGELVSGVTGKNYGALGSAFIMANPDKVTVVVRMPSSMRDAAGKAFEVTADGLKQWGAWHSYLKAKGYSTTLMEKRDYWTVPAAWPHLFDSEASIYDDTNAGEDYLAKRRSQRNAEFDYSTALRKAAVARKLGYDPSKRRAYGAANVPGEISPPPESSDDLKTPPVHAGDELRATMGLPPRPKARKPDDDIERFVEGFDI